MPNSIIITNFARCLKTGMSKDSNVTCGNDGVCPQAHKSHAGGLEQRQEDTETNSWYVVVVKARSELYCRQFLTNPAYLPYKVEAYVASQQGYRFSPDASAD